MRVRPPPGPSALVAQWIERALVLGWLSRVRFPPGASDIRQRTSAFTLPGSTCTVACCAGREPNPQPRDRGSACAPNWQVRRLPKGINVVDLQAVADLDGVPARASARRLRPTEDRRR